ncbi:MAG: hypothetical protein NTZ98_12465, partial [Acidobacteria bacterium]|nr:hypothetical protein [Acidobacteriota bacterium]
MDRISGYAARCSPGPAHGDHNPHREVQERGQEVQRYSVDCFDLEARAEIPQEGPVVESAMLLAKVALKNLLYLAIFLPFRRLSPRPGLSGSSSVLAVAPFTRARHRRDGSVRSDLADAVVARVADEEIAGGIHCDTTGRPQLGR